MAAPCKKRAVPDHENAEFEDSGENEEEEMEGQEFVNQTIQVEFEARNLEDSDFHGVRKLLSQLYLKANVDLSELTDTLISQNYIGSSIKQVELDEEEDDGDMDIDDDVNQVFGVISVINLSERKDLKCVKEIKSMLIDRCGKCASQGELAALLNDSSKSVGLVVNERFINIPAQIALPSFQSLWKEVERANQKKMKYDFTHYLMISKACVLIMKGPNGTCQEIRTYSNEEEELFCDVSSVTCEYSVKEEKDSLVQGSWDEEDDKMEPIRVAMVIPADRIEGIMDKMKEAYG